MGLAGRHGQIGKESLCLSRRKGKGSAGIEVGSKAAQQRECEPRHYRLGGLTLARASSRHAGHPERVHTSQSSDGRNIRPIGARPSQANLFTLASTDCSRPFRRVESAMPDHAEWIVFALILANQAGIPVFAAPALLAVGALAWTGDVNVAIAITGAMGASLCADLGWYTVGRWRGHWALAALGRLSRGTGTLVDDAQRLFLAHDRAFQLGARFLPELNPVAAAFAGVAGISLKRFLAGATVTAAMWAGTWIGV